MCAWVGILCVCVDGDFGLGGKCYHQSTFWMGIFGRILDEEIHHTTLICLMNVFIVFNQLHYVSDGLDFHLL